jgi:hypothetical protein
MAKAGAFGLAVVLGIILLGGCVDNKSAEGTESQEKKIAARLPIASDADIVSRLLGHDAAQQKLDPLTILATPPSVDFVSVGVEGPEPSIGVTSNGMIFFQAIQAPEGATDVGPATLRSDDGGLTWQNVAQPPFTSPTTLDPYLWVDQTTDRVFVDHLYLACSYLSYSDDYGATWVANPVACGLAGNDHQKMTTGPYRAPLAATPAYPNVVYYAYNGLAAGSRVSMSFDGGLTFPVNTQTVPSGECSGGLHGNIHAGRDGYVYVPKRACNGTVVAVSSNNGLTWQNFKVGQDVGSPNFRKNSEIATDTENNVYVIWPGRDNRLYLSVSRDHGLTWSPSSILASPPEITTTTMPAIVAGDAGRIAFAYYGVYQGNGEHPECVGNDEQWDVYVAWSLNALDNNPTFVTTRANPLNDPIQIGGISTNSGTPDPAKGCQYRRNLLDFIDMDMDKEGRIYVATADGCLECTSFNESVAALGIASTQITGPSLYANVPDFLTRPVGVGVRD